MPLGTFVRVLIVALPVLSFAACDGGVEPQNRDGFTVITLESEAGDYIGQGATYRYSQLDSKIWVRAVNGGLSVAVEGDEEWSGAFPPSAAQSRVSLGRHDGVPLNWEGDHRACGTTNGWWAVDEANYTDGRLTDVVFRFQQFCSGQGTGPSLSGEVRWSEFDSTEPPGPQFPIPASIWSPSASSMPDEGDFLYLESDPNDYIGQGTEWSYDLSQEEVEFVGTAGYIGFNLSGADRWSLDFQVMNVIDQVEPGLYPELQRHPFSNPYRGGFTVSGGSRGCNESRSWVAVDDVRFVDGVVVGVELRFEQFCDGNTDALRGALRWGG